MLKLLSFLLLASVLQAGPTATFTATPTPKVAGTVTATPDVAASKVARTPMPSASFLTKRVLVDAFGTALGYGSQVVLLSANADSQLGVTFTVVEVEPNGNFLGLRNDSTKRVVPVFYTEYTNLSKVAGP